MNIKLKNGSNMWVYWCDQCDVCKACAKSCNKEKTKEYINKLKEIKVNGVYGGLEFKCDYFDADDEKLMELYQQDTCFP